MKKSRRILIAALALCLCAVLAVAALAEGALRTMYRSAVQLLMETENASISAHATFAYNGLPFKTADLTYKQDGTNSLMDLKLYSPLAYGNAVHTGFTVVGNGDTAYSIEPVDNPDVYNTTATVPSSSILSSTAMSRAVSRLGGAVASACEGSFADKITVQTTEDGTVYNVRFRDGESPELINAAATLIAQIAANRYFYVDYSLMDDSPAEADPVDPSYSDVTVLYEDYDAVFADMYKRLYGEELPEDFYERMWGDDEEEGNKAYECYEAVSEAMEQQILEPIYDAYKKGIALIAADGTMRYFETADEYFRENNCQPVEFSDAAATFRTYYQKKTGDVLTEEMQDAIYFSDNEALYQAYSDMYDQMVEEYRAMARADEKASAVFVDAEGEAHPIYDYEAYERSAYHGDITLARSIMHSMRALDLGDTDLTVTLDQEGRLSAVKGTMCVLVTDDAGNINRLDITVDASVGQYGETKVGTFDPKAFGVMSWKEFISQTPTAKTEEPEPELPETMTFGGVEYKLMLDE